MPSVITVNIGLYFDQLSDLDRLSQKTGISRAELIRRAVGDMLKKMNEEKGK